MKIGVTSQNFRTVTGHAGKGRRFLIFSINSESTVEEVARLDLAKEMSLYAWDGNGERPLFELDYLITAGCGEGFLRRMAREGVVVRITTETNPLVAAQALIDGCLPEGVTASH